VRRPVLRAGIGLDLDDPADAGDPGRLPDEAGAQEPARGVDERAGEERPEADLAQL
jgi:hypothetical protein